MSECTQLGTSKTGVWFCFVFPQNFKGHERIRAVTSFDTDSDVAAVVSLIGDVQFIDYEYSGYNYLAYDIGNHFNEFAGKNWISEVKVNRFYEKPHSCIFSLCI